jgi:O-antigen ligase
MDSVVVRGMKAVDIVLIVAAVAALPSVVRNDFRLSIGGAGKVSLLLLMFVAIGLIPDILDPLAGGYVQAGEFAVASVLSIAVAGVIVRSPSDAGLVLSSYALGASISSGFAFVLNPVNGRADGLALHPNSLGLSASFGLCIAVWRLVESRNRLRLYYACLALLCAVGIVNSGSRSALPAVLCGIIVMLKYARFRVRPRHVVTLIGLVVALGASGVYNIASSPIFERLVVGAPESNAERTINRNEVFERVFAHPIVGSGFSRARQAHSVYVQVVDIAGWIGAMAFIAAFVAMWRAFKTANRRRRSPHIDVGAIGLGLVTTYAVASVFSNGMWDRWIWVPLAASLAGCRANDEPNDQLRDGSTLRGVTRVG